MKEKLLLGLYYFFSFLIRVTPRSIMRGIFKSVANLLYRIDKRRKKIAYINLDFAYGDSITLEEKTAIVKGCYENLTLNLLEFIRNLEINKETFMQKITYKNAHIVEKAMNENKKIIFITAHYGFWEFSPPAIAMLCPVTGVGRPLGMKALDDVLRLSREKFGVRLLDRKGAMKGLVKSLKEGRNIGLLVDQNTASNEGILVNFFGKKARHIPTAAVLARKFDALIIPAFIDSEDKEHFTFTFYEPIVTEKSDDAEKDILESVQKQADITEKVIRQNPKEWFWFHRRWKNQYEEIYQGL